MAEEQEFEVIDKRRVRLEGEGAGEKQTGSGGADAASTEGSAGQGRGVSAEELLTAAEAAAAQAGEGGAELPELDVPAALAVCVNMLSEVAWVKIGLIPNPVSGKIEKDLAQARVAIDAVGDLVQRLEPLVDQTERRDLQVMLSNLRINFVEQSQKG